MEQIEFLSQMKGKQSLAFHKPPYILASGNIVGKKEGEGPLGKEFDVICEDDKFGADNWEDAESTLQKEAVALALGKAKLEPKDMRYIFAGDLLGQNIATSFGLMNYEIPLFGLYGACSTAGESMALGAMCVAAGYAENVVTVTSSHFASAEKEFRFPLDYGNQRPLSATRTVTGSGAFVLANEAALQQFLGREWKGGEGLSISNSHVEEKITEHKPRKARAKITGMTVGKIVDFGLKDSMNMGACMAPAAASTLEQHFIDFESQPEDYDKIITGDLGKVGQRVLLDLLRDKGFDISDRHLDCGIEIYDGQSQDTHAGGSGCGCSAVTLSAYILKQLEEKSWKKVLFMPTGALLSKTSFNEGKSVPGIAHALVLESV